MRSYNQKFTDLLIKDVDTHVKRNSHKERYVLRFMALAMKHARARRREYHVIGVLDFNDLLQSSLTGLVEGFDHVDWDFLKDRPNAEKALINYLSAYITARIRRDTIRCSSCVPIPEYIIGMSDKEKRAEIIGSSIRQVFTEENSQIRRRLDLLLDKPILTNWDQESLNDQLTTIMFKYLNSKQREIIRLSFGIDCKKHTEVQIGKILGMSRRGVQESKKSALKKLKTDQNKFILYNYL